MFNDPALGAELIGVTNRMVFCDRREALYSASFSRDVEEWERMFHVLDAIYRFDYAIVSNRRSIGGGRVLDEDLNWSLAYVDDRALIYLKKAQ